MYKSQLQQLCQKRRWNSPQYSSTSYGPSHNPKFKASVYVNGLTFSSSDTSNICKQAHNQAAMFAFLNFTSPPPASSAPTNKYGSKQKVEAAKPQNSPVPPQSPSVPICGSSKLQPQDNARKNNLDPSLYTITTEGPPHDIHYKATVVINGKSIEYPTFFNTKVEAEQAVAKTLDLFQQDESCPSKSLLQELTQREGFSKPTYNTTQIGSPHMPTFFSTVEVEGVEFHGKASKSKKQAEHDAANMAYIALKECGLHMYAAFSSSIEENQDNVKCKQNLNLEDDIKHLDKEIFPTQKKMKMTNTSSSSFPHSNTDIPCVTNMSKSPNTSCYLLCNRYKVYTSFPNIVLPEGITVVPIGEDKWVLASLECSNDKDI